MMITMNFDDYNWCFELNGVEIWVAGGRAEARKFISGLPVAADRARLLAQLEA